MVSITINIKKKQLFIISLIVVFLVGVSFVFAYDWSSGNPSIMGHTSNEVDVRIDGNTKSLQQAIDDGDIGGGTISFTQCQVIRGKCEGGNIAVECPAGKVMRRIVLIDDGCKMTEIVPNEVRVTCCAIVIN